jgi:hypothetical protein
MRRRTTVGATLLGIEVHDLLLDAADGLLALRRLV